MPFTSTGMCTSRGKLGAEQCLRRARFIISAGLSRPTYSVRCNLISINQAVMAADANMCKINKHEAPWPFYKHAEGVCKSILSAMLVEQWSSPSEHARIQHCHCFLLLHFLVVLFARSRWNFQAVKRRRTWPEVTRSLKHLSVWL